MAPVGPYSLHALAAGRFGLDGGAMFGIVPKPLWSQRISPDDQNRIPLATRCLLLDGDARLILVDTGIGDTFAGSKYEDIYAVDPGAGGLEDALAQLGFGPSDVTDVVLTHLHFDHCGGGTRRGASGSVEVAFPNATYHVQKEHWDWATTSNPKENASFRPETFRPIEEAGQLHLVDGSTTLFPHVSVEPVNGHTKAQQIVKVQGDDTTLVYVADLLPTTHHFAPAWTMAYDVRPLVTINEKQAFLERAVDESWSLFFEHDPEVAVADVERTEKGIQAVRPRSVDAL